MSSLPATLGACFLVVACAAVLATCDDTPCGEQPKDDCSGACEGGYYVCVESGDEHVWKCECGDDIAEVRSCSSSPTDCGGYCPGAQRCVDGTWSCEHCNPCSQRNDNCPECRACEHDETCHVMHLACRADPACDAYSLCVTSCQGLACVDACAAANPEGQASYAPIGDCVCQGCAERCSPICGGSG